MASGSASEHVVLGERGPLQSHVTVSLTLSLSLSLSLSFPAFKDEEHNHFETDSCYSIAVLTFVLIYDLVEE